MLRYFCQLIAPCIFALGIALNVSAEEYGDTSLHQAAARGDAAEIESLIKGGKDVNARASLQFTPLHLAAKEGHASVVIALTRAGANVNAQAEDDITPIHLAINEGHSSVIDVLIRNGADVNLRTEAQQLTPLHVAAINDDPSAIKSLIGAGADVNPQDSYGATPLHMAADRGYVFVLAALIRNNAGVNTLNSDGRAPLHLAAQNGNAYIIENLIRSGARVNVRAKDKWTALHFAAFNGHASAVHALIRGDANVNLQTEGEWTPLHFAISAGNPSAFRAIINKGADVNTHDFQQNTPLHMAAKEGHIWAVTTLINKGAYVNPTNKAGDTPLGIARQHKKWGIVGELEKHLQQIAQETPRGNQPPHTQDKETTSKNPAKSVFAKVWKSIVVIRTPSGQGSGVIVRAGIVATNCHVVEGDAYIGIYTGSVKGRVIDTNLRANGVVIRRIGDLCLLRGDGITAQPMVIRDSETIDIGETMYAIGSPKGLDYTMTQGIVSARRTYEYGVRHVQTDAAISPGSSGGGLFDSDGRLVGITTFGMVGGENLNFAIAADHISALLQ